MQQTHHQMMPIQQLPQVQLIQQVQEEMLV
jgi:hypothetical protein